MDTGGDVKLTTHPPLVVRLCMGGAVPLLPIYICFHGVGRLHVTFYSFTYFIM
jgi:hypothetical protein